MRLACVFLIALLACGCAASPPPVPAPSPSSAPSPSPSPVGAQWTWMVYIDAQTDLEKEEMTDLEEMLSAGSTPDVNIIVLCARAPSGDEEAGYTNQAVANLPNWTSCKLLKVEKGKLVELDDWGEVSMSTPGVLRQFIEVSMARFPARHYALNLNDHGQGWSGCCGDDTSDDPDAYLTLPRLEEAIGDGLKGHRLDLLGFDACLMASLEVARALAPHARYLVASEEMEPSTGWSYGPTMKALAAHPEMDGEALGRRIADDYQTSFKDDDEGLGITLSVIDLARVESLAGAIETLAEQARGQLQAGRPGWLPIAAARARAEQYGKSDEEGEDSADAYDVGGFADEMKKRVPASRETAEQVRQRLGDAVVYNVHGEGRPGANGLSVFLPKKRKVLDEGTPLTYAHAMGKRGAGWVQFLKEYTRVTGLQKNRPALSAVRTSAPVVRAGKAIEVSAQGPADDVEDAFFVLAQKDGDSTMIVGQFPTEADAHGGLSETWDGSWFHLTDGKHDVMCPIETVEKAKGDDVTVQVPLDWRRPGWKQWHDLTLHFYVHFKAEGGADGKLIYAFEETRNGPREVTLKKGDRMRPIYLDLDPDGKQTYVYSEDAADQLAITRTNGVTVDWLVLPPDRYKIGFVVKDYADNRSRRLTDVEIKE